MKLVFIKILKLLSPYKWWMLLAAFVGFLTIGSSIGLLMTSAYIIAKAALHPSISELQVGIVGVRFFGISRGVFRYAERLISHEVTFSILAKFRVWFFKSIEPLVPSKTEKFTSGDLLSRVVADVESLEHIFVRVISPPLVATFVGILIFVIFSFYNILLALIFIIPYSLAGIGVPLFTYKLSSKYGKRMIALRTRLTELTIDGIEGKRDLIAFQKSDEHKTEFNNVNSELVFLQRKMKLISGLNESLIGLLMNIAVILVFIAATPFVKAGAFNGVHLSVLTLGTMAAFEAVLPIPLALQYLKNSIVAGERVFQIADKKTEEKTYADKKLNGDKIEFSDVVFSYRDNEAVLKKINLKLNRKEKIAIIGGSGAGKSSIINLLLNFWKVDDGKITMDNINYNTLSGESIRNAFSTIPQKVFLFSDTIKGNLLLAKPTATDEELWSALRKAELEELVKSLPEKLDTWIGNQGKQLSGGEKKRMAIARAILKDAPVFICDEITADIDAINERKIVNTIHSITNNKGLLFITHRLVDMEKFDSIYLLEKGEIVVSGKHVDLLNISSEYRKYFL